MSATSPTKRTSLFVRDLERATRFYEDIIGLQLWIAPDPALLSSPASRALLGVGPRATIRCRILRHAEAEWGMVGLFEVTPGPGEPPRPSLPPPGTEAALGEACLVMFTDDIEGITAKLRAGGHMVLCPPTRFQLGPSVDTIEMTFRDPDGVLVNLIQGHA